MKGNKIRNKAHKKGEERAGNQNARPSYHKNSTLDMNVKTVGVKI